MYMNQKQLYLPAPSQSQNPGLLCLYLQHFMVTLKIIQYIFHSPHSPFPLALNDFYCYSLKTGIRTPMKSSVPQQISLK